VVCTAEVREEMLMGTNSYPKKGQKQGSSKAQDTQKARDKQERYPSPYNARPSMGRDFDVAYRNRMNDYGKKPQKDDMVDGGIPDFDRGGFSNKGLMF